MPFNVIAYYESQTATALSGIAAVNDTIHTTSGDDVTLWNNETFCFGAYCLGVSTPELFQLRQITRPIPIDLANVQLGGVQMGTEAGLSDLRFSPIPLTRDKLNMFVRNATAEISAGVFFVGNENFAGAEIPDFIVYGKADPGSALSAGVWNSVTMTWENSLPAGYYRPIGLQASTYLEAGAKPVAARLILPNIPWRPGVPALKSLADHTNNLIPTEIKNFGKWKQMPELTFPYDQMPKLEVFTLTADTDVNCVLSVKLVR